MTQLEENGFTYISSFYTKVNGGTKFYNGKEQCPEISVMDNYYVYLTKDIDYTVSYSNNINAGTANFCITGIGKYSGKINGTFEIQKIALDPVSLETPIGEEDDSHLGDFIEDEGAMSPDDYAANELLKDELNDVLLELTDREEKVLRLRFGLDDGRTRTLEEVGREFNVTRERIRQIEAKALRKLKHPSRSKRLKDFLDR